MIAITNFEQRYNELISNVENEIEKVEKGVSKKSRQQLKTIESEMKKMYQFRDVKQLLEFQRLTWA